VTWFENFGLIGYPCHVLDLCDCSKSHAVFVELHCLRVVELADCTALIDRPTVDENILPNDSPCYLFELLFVGSRRLRRSTLSSRRRGGTSLIDRLLVYENCLPNVSLGYWFTRLFMTAVMAEEDMRKSHTATHFTTKFLPKHRREHISLRAVFHFTAEFALPQGFCDKS